MAVIAVLLLALVASAFNLAPVAIPLLLLFIVGAVIMLVWWIRVAIHIARWGLPRR